MGVVVVVVMVVVRRKKKKKKMDSRRRIPYWNTGIPGRPGTVVVNNIGKKEELLWWSCYTYAICYM